MYSLFRRVIHGPEVVTVGLVFIMMVVEGMRSWLYCLQEGCTRRWIGIAMCSGNGSVGTEVRMCESVLRAEYNQRGSWQHNRHSLLGGGRGNAIMA